MKFLYFLAAIGGPNLENKFKILARNLIHIHHTLKRNFSIAVNCYNSSDEVSRFIRKFSFLDNIYFHHRPNSVLTELWFTSPYREIYAEYDEILFILDDVSISRLYIPSLINIRNKYKLDIISPAIVGATWPYMQPYNSSMLAITNHLEVYCMLMTPENFKRYLDINTFENKWIWGVDHLFGHFGINTAVYHGMHAHHIIPHGHGCDDEAMSLMIEYLQSKGFKNLNDVKQRYPVIKQIVTI